MLGLIPGELMKWRPLFLVLLALTAAAPAWSQAAKAVDDHPPCDIPPELTTPSAPLARFAAALAAGESVDILAIGSGSTVGKTAALAGPASSHRTPDASFPYRMLDMLQVARQDAKFRLTVKGGRNMTAEAMAAILRQELAAHHYALVIWQTGTVEAVRGLRPDYLHSVLQEGVEAAGKADADVVLIDPQFSRFLRTNTDLAPYEMVLQQIASLPGVSLFRRFDLTQIWVNNGQVDLERVSRDQRDKTIARLNTCLGHALAQFVLTGAGEH
jgi:acyl-CoA thioesterase I